jgi:non-reducing end alpha-L-arabinofuranosidase
MRLTGSIILGIGGDNSDGAAGVFMEGAVLIGASSEDVDAAVQANINSVYSTVSLV